MTAEASGIEGARMAFFGSAERAVLVSSEAELDNIDFLGDAGASAALKRQLASVLVKRAIENLEGAGA